MTRRLARPLLALALLPLALPAHAEVRTQEVTYDVDGQEFSGYFAWDEARQGERPGVLVLHEWWGQDAYARRRARMLAELGYTAFALDMYGNGKVAEHPEDAQAFMQSVMSDMERAERRFDKAHDLLRAHPTVAAGRTAAIGYCMGGGLALYMARVGKELDAVVSFHGSLGAQAGVPPAGIEADLLVLTGGSDPFVPDAQVEAFRQAMEAAEVDYELHVYPGAKHAFTNPAADRLGAEFDLPLAYDAEADADSWQRMRRFLEQRLQAAGGNADGG
ncbi:MAG: dienelactone hydrolase family protein [Halofilum sp. (in: g-proteobacteria)]|nr:dienelactone hydrolase family protein [Halofilum sp. (in: g-proteobacteria)]